MPVTIPKLSWPYPIPLSGKPAAPTPVVVQSEIDGAQKDGTVTWELGLEDTNEAGGVAFGPIPSAYTIPPAGPVAISDPVVVVTVRSGAGNRGVRMVGAVTFYPTRVLLKRDGTVQVDFELNLQSGISA
jgi:hypothetical protein